MKDERLSDEQVSQLIGLGQCFLHQHTDEQGGQNLIGGIDYLMPSQIGVDLQAFDAQLFSHVPQVAIHLNYSVVATDAGKHVYHEATDPTARNVTIPANSAVPFPVGTVITFVNGNGAGVLTIQITSDTIRLAGAGTTGFRTLAANGVATAMKISASEWIISGTGLT
jgi:hypothetical protein